VAIDEHVAGVAIAGPPSTQELLVVGHRCRRLYMNRMAPSQGCQAWADGGSPAGRKAAPASTMRVKAAAFLCALSSWQLLKSTCTS
jgi:hypothetical protein